MYGGNAYGWAYYGDESQAGVVVPPVVNPALQAVLAVLTVVKVTVANFGE